MQSVMKYRYSENGKRGRMTASCSDCQSLLEGSKAFNTTYRNVITSAQQINCTCCKWVATAIFDHAYTELLVPDKLVNVSQRTLGIVEILEVDVTKWKDELLRLEICNVTERPPIVSFPSGPLKPIIIDPGTEAASNLIRGWMQNCLDCHKQCQQESLPRLPTRVIDVSSTNPRIRETHGTKGMYMALSHCWGQERGLMLTQTNLPVLTTSINITALPKSLQHTITLTRRLGVESLWIDSLCIIQDSVEDWARESSKMWDVYRNSHLTIVAVGSPSDAQGFLDSREYLPTTSTSDTHKMICRRNPHSGPREPLYDRAWTFQERFLSPRMIKFKRYELEWHCRTSKICECGHYTEDSHPYTDLYSNMFLDLGKREDVYMFWRSNIVQSYSRLHLTKPSDRLPALSGIATMVARRFPEEKYLAGLWLGDIARGLQWYRNTGAELLTDCEQVLSAPSWSWASMLGPVTYTPPSQPRGSTLASVKEYRCELAGIDTHGEVKRGRWLIIFAPVLQLRATVIYSAPGDGLNTHHFVRTHHDDKGIHIGPKTSRAYKYYPDRVHDPLGMENQFFPLNGAAVSPRIEDGVASEDAWVWIAALEIEEQADCDVRICRCLVLGVDGSDETSFTRVGFWVFEDVHGWLDGAECRVVRIT